MKYMIATGVAVVSALAALWWLRMHPEDAHAEWKRYAVEKETAERPARFEDMKFKPTEVRLPASDEK